MKVQGTKLDKWHLYITAEGSLRCLSEDQAADISTITLAQSINDGEWHQVIMSPDMQN